MALRIRTRPGSAAPAGRRVFSCARGVTYVEVILVVVIVLVGSAIAIPRMASAASRYRAQSAVRRIEQDLAKAREVASSTSSAIDVQFAPGGTRYALVPSGGKTWSNAALGRLRNNMTDLGVAPYQAVVMAADFGGGQTITFDAYGVAQGSGVVTIKAGIWGGAIRVDAASGGVRTSVFRWPEQGNPPPGDIPPDVIAFAPVNKPATPATQPTTLATVTTDIQLGPVQVQVATTTTTVAAGGGGAAMAAAPKNGK